MITIDEYATKVETFVDLYRQGIISPIELVESIHSLEQDVFIIEGNYSVTPSSRIKQRKQD